MLIANTKVSKLHKAFANNTSANLKLSKIQNTMTIQLKRFFGRLPGWLRMVALPL